MKGHSMIAGGRAGVAIACLLFLCAPPAYAAAVTADEVTGALNVSRMLEYREDASGAMTIDRARDPAGASGWRPNDREFINFGYTRSAYWFRLTVHNPPGYSGRLLLEIDFASLDTVDFYYPDGSGGYASIRTGDRRPFADRGIPDRNYLFPLNRGEGVSVYYLRIANQGSLRFQAQLYPARAVIEERNRFLPLAWFLYGMILLTSVFYFFLYVFLLDRTYLYFSLFALSIFFHQLTLRGFAFQHLWPGWPWWNNVMVLLMMNGMGLFSALFVRNILDMGATNRHFHRGFGLFAHVLFPVLAACALFLPYRHVALATYYTLFAYGALFIPSIVYYLFKGNRFARYFIAGGVILVLTNLISSFTALGRLPLAPVTEWSNEMGQMLLVLFATLGMVDRFWNIDRDLLASRQCLADKNVALERTNEELRKSLDEEIALVRDVHDRVKNNMQVVCSLLNLQAGTLTDPEAVRALTDAVARIHSMAGIHERIYRTESYSRVDMGSHVEELARHLVSLYGCADGAKGPVRIVTRLARAFLPVDRAVPLGLLLSELLTGAIRHASAGDAEPEIELVMQCNGDAMDLEIAGSAGMARGMRIGVVAADAGAQIVEALSRQAGASVSTDADNGRRVTVHVTGCAAEA